MCQLHRVVQKPHILGLLDLDGRVGLLESLAPLFLEPLVVVATVSKRADGVDVEWVFPLAHDGLFLHRRLVRLPFVRLETVHFDAFENLLLLLLLRQLRKALLDELCGPPGRCFGVRVLGVGGVCPHLYHFSLELALDSVKLCLADRKVLAAPVPLHPPLARLARDVKVARRAHGLVNDRHGLKAIGQNDVGVHCTHVKVVNHGEALDVGLVA